MDPRECYVAAFLEESLGLARGDIESVSIPSELIERIVTAMRGAEASASEEPAVEQMVQAFGREAIKAIEDGKGFVLRKERWPLGVEYAACLTHDVDNLSRPLSHIIQRRSRFALSDFLLAVLGLKQLYDNISLIAGFEASRKLHSSFYLLTANYDLGKKSKELNSLLAAGWDIGLHGDLLTHDSEEKMAEALSKFQAATGIKPAGVREHFLKFDYESTWRIMEESGLVYDSTVGNTDELGFRVGLCTPFHPPDADWKPRKILELPLVLMDTTLWGYLKRSEGEGMKDFDRLREAVKEANGLFTILWHPESARMKGGRIYPELLDRLVGDGCFIGSGRAIADWWTRRSVPLVWEGGEFRMEDAPAGLVLRLKAKGGERATADGGVVGAEGGSETVTASGGPLRIKLS